MARALGKPLDDHGPAEASRPGAGRARALVRRLLSPEIGFPVLWLLGVALAQIRLYSFQEHGGWSLRVWTVMALVPIAFVCGAAVGRAAADLIGERVRPGIEPSERDWRRASLVLLAIGTLEAVHQLVIAGGIPLFDADIDRSRFDLPGGPLVILTNCGPLAAAVALAGPRVLDPRRCRVEFAVAFAGLGVVALLGGRGQVILGVALIVLLRSLRFGPPSPKVLGGAVTALVLFIALVFFFRARQNTGQPFEAELYNEVLPDVPSPLRILIPLHVAIGSNFEALAQVVGFFPDQLAFGHGAYDAWGFDRVIPGSKHVGDVSARLTPPFTTSTVAGPLWADGGFGWVAGGLAAIGALVGCVHRLATRTLALRYMLPAAYLVYLTFFGIYTSLFTQHPDWVVITPLLFLTGAWLDGIRPRATLRRLASYGVPLARGSRVTMRTLTDQRRKVLAALGAVVLVVGLAIAIGSTLGDDPENPASGTTIVGQPGGTLAADPRRLVSNSDANLDNEPLWAARRRPGSVTLTGYAFRRGRPWGRAGSVRIPARVPANARLDVASWVGESRALFAMRVSQQRVSVEVWGATTRRLVSAGAAAEPSPFVGGSRHVAIGTYSGLQPDLYIIDYGVEGERARMAVYSGESAFRTPVLKQRLPVLGLNDKNWTLELGTIVAGRPDLLLLTRRGGGTGKPELHVLSGATNYRGFRLQLPIEPLTPGREPSLKALTIAGHPVAAAVDESSGVPARLTMLALGPRVGG